MNNVELLTIGLLIAICATLILIAWWTRGAYVAARHTLRQRDVLPMSVSQLIRPTQSAQITARPQLGWFKPERLFISGAGTDGGAADWVINDIKIGGQSQFTQSGDIPGDMFSTDAVDTFVSWATANQGADVVLVVTYVGTKEEGAPFYASFVGEGPDPVTRKRPRSGRIVGSVTAN